MPKIESKMSKQNIAILGASRDSAKYGNKAVRAYASKGYGVYPINPNATNNISSICIIGRLGLYPEH